MSSQLGERLAGAKLVLQAIGVGVGVGYFGIIAILMYPVVEAAGYLA